LLCCSKESDNIDLPGRLARYIDFIVNWPDLGRLEQTCPADSEFILRTWAGFDKLGQTSE
jgi:hypothetical protein